MKQWPFTMAEDPFLKDPYVVLWRNVLLQLMRDLTYCTVKRGNLKMAYEDALKYLSQPDKTDLAEVCCNARVPYDAVVKAIQGKDYMRLGQSHLKWGKPSRIPGYMLRREVWQAEVPAGNRAKLLRKAGVCESNLYRRPHRKAKARERLAELVGLKHDELWEPLDAEEEKECPSANS